MKINEIITEAESYQPPELAVGDKILKGKFKNSPAEITGFIKDKHNQPVLKTNKGAVQLFKPRVTKLMATEAFSNGLWNGDRNAFSAKLVHETTPDRAESIRINGFKGNPEGIFFNLDSTGYSGGGYGGVYITCNISGPAEGILDLSNDNGELDEFSDGGEIASYAKANGYWAWKDDLQMSVLDPRHIQLLSINR